jgi:hypothetical protein
MAKAQDGCGSAQSGTLTLLGLKAISRPSLNSLIPFLYHPLVALRQRRESHSTFFVIKKRAPSLISFWAGRGGIAEGPNEEPVITPVGRPGW